MLDKSPVSGPRRGPSSCNTSESGWKELVSQYITLVGQLEHSLQIVSTIFQTILGHFSLVFLRESSENHVPLREPKKRPRSSRKNKEKSCLN